MKARIVLFFFASILFTAVQAQQNEWIKLQDNPGHINRLLFTSPDTGFAATSDGRIIRTTNGGSSWRDVYAEHVITSQGPTFITWPIKSVFALGSQKVYFTANNQNTIYFSDDQGNNWLGWIYVDFPDMLYLTDVFFMNEDVAFASAKTGWVEEPEGDGVLLRTQNASDNGFDVNWEVLETGTTDQIARIAFVNETEGFFLTTDGVLYHSVDEGANWSVETTINEAIHSFEIHDQTIWFAGDNGMIANKNCSTGEWSIQSTGSTTHLRTVHFADDNIGWLAGDMGEFWSTSDGGNSWQLMSNPGVGAVYQVFGFEDGSVYVSGENGNIMKSADHGASWNISYGEFDDFNDAHFVSGNMGWAAANGGLVYKTVNGGNSWTPHSTGVSFDIQAVHFLDEEKGFACAWTGWQTTGNLLYTTDGGSSWNIHNDVSGRLADVFFIDENTGWIAVDDGRVFKTNNGGDSWSEVANEGQFHERVFFVNVNVGWLIGSTVRRTTDGGQTWDLQDVGNIQGIHFLDEQTGWICGPQKIYGTTDGGNSWNELWSESWGVGSSIFKAVFFEDEMHGWAMGYYDTPSQARIAYTEDGGETWQTDFYITPSSILTIERTPQNRLVALGENGVVLSYSSDLASNVIESYPSDPFQVVVFPNPAAGYANLKLKLEKNAFLDVSMHDVSGRKISSSQQSLMAGEHQLRLDLNGLSDGLYLVRISDNQHHVSVPVIVQR